MKNKLLAGILSAAMLLTMGAVPVMADTASDAGTAADATLQSQIDSAASGAVIELANDYTESITIKSGEDIILDLNGHTLTNTSGKDTITVDLGGKLTVEGNGTVDNVSHSCAAVFNSGTAVLNGGAYTRSKEAGTRNPDGGLDGGNSWYYICNHGIMTINDGVTISSAGQYSSLIENGYSNYNGTDPRIGYVKDKNNESPELTINGGIFSGGFNTVKNDDNGSLIINGGQFTNSVQTVILNWNKTKIAGGTFTIDKDECNAYAVVINMGASESLDIGEVTITGGTFINNVADYDYSTVVCNNGNSINITGGSFSMAQGKSAVANNGTEIKVSGGTFSAPVDPEFCADGFNPVTTTDAYGNTVYMVDNYVKPPAPTMYKVTAGSTENGTLNVGVTSEAEGRNVAIDPVPAEGYELDTVTVTDSNGKSIEVTKTEENEYIFKMPSSDVTVNAAFKKAEDHSANCPSKAFTDVDTAQFYHNAVDWAVTKKVTSGTSATTFSPETTCTRAELVTFIWRAAGSPAAAASLDFTDVAKSDYCYNAVQWAVEHNITVGTGENKFSPDETVDRSQVVTFLYRYAGSPDVTGSSQFSDVKDTDFFANAVQWAVANSITSGTSATEFAPARSCTRAEAVTLLYNYFSK